MKKLIFCFMFILSMVMPQQKASALSVSAQFACLIDAQTGRVIYEKAAYERHSMASTTKIMTALVALEQGNLDDLVTVGKNAAGTEGTSLYLKQGDRVLLSDLLYGLMLQSGNDAAIAIAEHVGETTEKFAVMMTERAKSIGAKNTAFKNPNGLDEDGHFTTAYDLALITREAVKNKTFSEIVATKSKTIRNGTQTVTNHNKMLRMYSGCVGVKTGFTKKTGRCLVTAAERDGKKLIAVTLNAPNDWNDHTNMLDYGFQNTVRFPLIAAGMTVNAVTVRGGESESVEVTADNDFYLTESPDTKFQNAEIVFRLPESVDAPVTQGEILGVMEIFYKDQLLESMDLVAAADVGQQTVDASSDIINIFKKFLVFGCVE